MNSDVVKSEKYTPDVRVYFEVEFMDGGISFSYAVRADTAKEAKKIIIRQHSTHRELKKFIIKKKYSKECVK